MSLIDKLKDTHWPIEIESHKQLLKCMTPEDCNRLVNRQSVYDLPGKVHRIRFKSLSDPKKRMADIFSMDELRKPPGQWSVRRGSLKTTVLNTVQSDTLKHVFKEDIPYYQCGNGYMAEIELMEDVIKIIKAVKEFMREIDD